MRFVCIPRKAVRAVCYYPQESGAHGSCVSPGKRCARFVFIPSKAVRAVRLYPRERGAHVSFVSAGKRSETDQREVLQTVRPHQVEGRHSRPCPHHR